MGLISSIEINLSTCNEEYSSEETYSDTDTNNNSSAIVEFLLEMVEISQQWPVPITITIASDS